MIVALDNTYSSQLYFLPARNSDGLLVGLKVVCQFSGLNNHVRIPTSLVLPRLTQQQEITLFQEKLALLTTCQLFFMQHNLTAWIMIPPGVVDALLNDEELAASVQRLPFLELAVSEQFPRLNDIDENHPLSKLSHYFPLALSDFGAGNASTRAVFTGLFKRIVLDKSFVQRQLKSLSFEPFMRAIVSQIQPYCQGIMISGIDDETIRQRVMPYGFNGMLGSLWPVVPESSLITLVQQ
ncbi:EAL domain-containing protein [Kluyvera ascorbata]|uniref:EAL domain-containing protein n=1 Tax=Kluyvera ascorbata TaxID=51288 RepID=UPI0022E12970|nr:EAL domain-containing protein [Kluyvera ascorbata]